MTVKPAYVKAIGVWVALMALLALTCGSAFVSLGAWNSIANFGIAVLKALLVAAFFMHLTRAPVYRIVILCAIFVLSLLLGLSAADYSTRTPHAAPWQVPQGSVSSVQ